MFYLFYFFQQTISHLEDRINFVHIRVRILFFSQIVPRNSNSFDVGIELESKVRTEPHDFQMVAAGSGTVEPTSKLDDVLFEDSS